MDRIDRYENRTIGWSKNEVLVLLNKMRRQALKPEDLKLSEQARHYVITLEHAGIIKTKKQVAFQLIRLYSKYLRLRHQTMRGKKAKQWLYLHEMDKIMIIQFLHREENKGQVTTIRRFIKRIGIGCFFKMLALRSRRRAILFEHKKNTRQDRRQTA